MAVNIIDLNNKLNFNTQTGSYTLVLSDEDKTILTSGSSVINITVPQNSSVPFTIGTSIGIIGAGSGVTTILTGSGATINSIDGLILDGRYAVASVTKIDTNIWIASGRLTV